MKTIFCHFCGSVEAPSEDGAVCVNCRDKERAETRRATIVLTAVVLSLWAVAAILYTLLKG